MFVYALPGAASFAACLKLFRSYPLAVTPCYSGGWQRSIVLRHRAFEGCSHPGREAACEPRPGLENQGSRHGSGFYVLTWQAGDCFTVRPWRAGDGEMITVSPEAPVPVDCHRVITEGMPVPRNGALLGWISDRQATVLLSVFHGDGASLAPGPAGQGALAAVPQVRVLAMVGSEPIRWPPFTASPLDDGRLWEYVERGELVDLAPLVRSGGGASWVPSQHPGRADQGHGCVVVARNLQADDFWVPAGTYMDHWMLREGVPAPPASHLLALPGTTDLSARLAS